MKVNCEFNIDLQRWEWVFVTENNSRAYAFEDHKWSETQRRVYLVNWLNKCFEANEQSKTSQ